MNRRKTIYPYSSVEGHIESLGRELWDEHRECEMLRLACKALYEQLREALRKPEATK